MHVHHVDIKSREHFHCFADCVGDIVELEVKEYLMAAAFDFFHNLVAGSVIELHSNLEIGLAGLVVEFVKEAECLLGVGEIAGYDYVSVHIFFI